MKREISVQDKKITCIIPAYNEEKRISKVLEIVLNHPLIKETIVINDNSQDRTLETIKSFKVSKVINNKKNIGKTQSVLRGLKTARTKIILLLDADLINLNKENLSQLILPVLNKQVKVTIALFGTIPLFRIIGADSGSGQRVFDKRLVDFKKIKELERYGLESYMNDIIIKNNYPLKIIDWKNVGCTTKGGKENSKFPFKAYMSMWIQMIRTSGFLNFLLQSFKLSHLSSKNK